MYRALIIHLVDGNKVVVEEDQLREIFASFNLPFPHINKPVLSMEFRKLVCSCGIVTLMKDEDSFGMIRHILPYQIKHIDFFISNEIPDNIFKYSGN